LNRWEDFQLTSIFSAISGQFSRSLILGTFLPVVLFTVLGLLFLPSLFPFGSSPFQPLAALDKEWQVVAVTFIAVLITGLLYNLNIPIIRIYEGYPWIRSGIGTWRKESWGRRFTAVQKLTARLRFLDSEIESNDSNGDLVSSVQAERIRLELMLNQGFPGNKSLVMPTHLGNVIRSFETYPLAQYGMEAITLWPRLIAKIDKDYAALIDEAKASFDFMINCSLLSAIFAALLIFTGLFFSVPLASMIRFGLWSAEWIGFSALSYLSYSWAVGRAAGWGVQVKGAFDLYRWDLLRQLGYKYTPSTRADERAIWVEISQQIMYKDAPTFLPLPYGAQTVVDVEPPAVKIDVVKGVSVPSLDQTITVTFRIRNVDPKMSVARRVTLSDPLPDGYAYVWDSAQSSDGKPSLLASSPATFGLDNIAPSKDILLSYSAVALGPPKPPEKPKGEAKVGGGD
jgi:uncharacterized repeat protein (TIGR01451 family)